MWQTTVHNDTFLASCECSILVRSAGQNFVHTHEVHLCYKLQDSQNFVRLFVVSVHSKMRT